MAYSGRRNGVERAKSVDTAPIVPTAIIATDISQFFFNHSGLLDARYETNYVEMDCAAMAIDQIHHKKTQNTQQRGN